ncbi:Chorismate synthase [Sulfolobus islandicus Y.G.57.14]|jgi:chorismate synthase|uniref:Chorismate synthase n=8 Tax=Saccharolobus islandicus TaxID=43080 RepID=AROC_SACI2|nr:chorismate synthase [Sulfolobus islandicus]C3MRB7.1 RecName: Full=Chorismate synthase; Short=CS; AltName: Full=5-enolpyruvylshikimate-3-phosphate phospholyase [Sulfolobus islandicus L.S.2.15]C3MXK6.1 RecName: Full=Chorismate synthase; Short=CS; AltName: Full=5-enolpyruvylshikimate-3-phosphate phospholyase [Sulfolobus islandicus M.14.25]C3N7H4.1 RecName: Full=Chorismate synthase; Short=CS; AltName: Full=5-enolpyruvylshikimate-3-phosphate phospholyase [Sulfolobus islandicus Y.G.57.14]C4KIN2.1 
MPGNSFGKLFRVTTFGESHGPAVGVVIDGVPAGLPLTVEDIKFELEFRRPGRLYVSGRREKDEPEILSGIFNNRTTGSPIAVIVRNTDVISSFYEEIRYKPRPGHADLPFIMKYGYENWDYRGGGRASARETVGRVIAGAVAKKLLMLADTWIAGHLRSLGPEELNEEVTFEEVLCSKYSPVRASKKVLEEKYEALIKKATQEGDSYGGIAEVITKNPPIGLGEPVFDKMKAELAKAIMSIPAVTGFEYGLGFMVSKMKGSEANDEIIRKDNKIGWKYNYAGGILGGLTNGEDLIVRCAFKPTSSIRKPQKTIDLRNLEETYISVIGRHDPAVAIRGVTVVESMVALTLVDHAMRAGVIPLVKLTEEQGNIVQQRWERYVRSCKPMEESQL